MPKLRNTDWEEGKRVTKIWYLDENIVIDTEIMDRYDLSMMKLVHAFTHDGREAELEVIEEGPTVLVNVKVLTDQVQTRPWYGARIEDGGMTIVSDGTENDSLEVVTGRSKMGLMIQLRFDLPEWRTFVKQLEIFGER